MSFSALSAFIRNRSETSCCELISSLQSFHLNGHGLSQEDIFFIAKTLGTLNIPIRDIRLLSLKSEFLKIILNALNHVTYATSILIEDCVFDDDDMKSLISFLDIHTTLRRLRLRRNRIGIKELQYLSPVLEGNKSLLEFYLEHSEYSVDGAMHVAAGLRKNDRLEILSLSETNCGDYGAELITDAMRCKLNPGHLKSLDLSSNGLRSKVMKHISLVLLHTNGYLEELNLSYNKTGDDGVKYLADGLVNNSSLLKLCLTSVDMRSKGMRHLSSALKSNGHLKSLILSVNDIRPEGVEHLADALTANTSVTLLSLHDCNLRDDGAESLGIALEKNHSLLHLELSSNAIGDRGAMQIAFALGEKNSSLKKLDLGDNAIGEDGLMHLAKVLESNRSLNSLVLRANSIRDEGARFIANALAVNASLMRLDVCDNEISDRGVRQIAAAIGGGRNSCLQYLNLDSNKITDEGAIPLADALARNRSLKVLRMSRNELHAETAAHFASCLEVNTTLSTLIFQGCYFGSEGATKIALAMEKNSTLRKLDLSVNDIDNEGSWFLAESLKENGSLMELELGGNKEIDVSGIDYFAAALKKNENIYLIEFHLGSEAGMIPVICEVRQRKRRMDHYGFVLFFLFRVFHKSKCGILVMERIASFLEIRDVAAGRYVKREFIYVSDWINEEHRLRIAVKAMGSKVGDVLKLKEKILEDVWEAGGGDGDQGVLKS